MTELNDKQKLMIIFGEIEGGNAEVIEEEDKFYIFTSEEHRFIVSLPKDEAIKIIEKYSLSWGSYWRGSGLNEDE